MTQPPGLPPPGRREEGVSSDLPLAQAARSLHTCNRPFDDLEPEQLLATLYRARDGDAACESVLFAQAHVLDAVFHRLINRAVTSSYSNDPKQNHIDDQRMGLALRAQKQCRATIEALAKARFLEKYTSKLKNAENTGDNNA